MLIYSKTYSLQNLHTRNQYFQQFLVAQTKNIQTLNSNSVIYISKQHLICSEGIVATIEKKPTDVEHFDF